MRSRTRRRVALPRKRAVWINIPFGGVAFTESVGNQDLLVPEDWEASFTGLTQERAVLRAIVGDIHMKQTVAGTSGGNMMWGIYLAGANEAAVPTFTTTGMSEVVWLTTGSLETSSVITDTAAAATNTHTVLKINVKAKRKLDTRTKISLAAQFAADAASPAGIASGLLRFLVARD